MHQLIRRLTLIISLTGISANVSASPLGPDPLFSFEGRIGYQANAETLLNCTQPVCDAGLGPSGFACSTLSSSVLTMSQIPELTPGFQLVFADLSWAGSEGAQNLLDTEVTLTSPNGQVFNVSASDDRSESFTDGLAMCQQLIPFICAEAPSNLSCDLQFFAHHADLTDVLSEYRAGGGQLNGNWILSDISLTGSSISDPQTAIAAVGSLTIGAWSLLLVYEAPDLPTKKIYYYQGLELNEGVNRQLYPTGFTAPPDPAVDLTFMVLEGDQSISGDQLRLNGRQISDSCNPANNVFNSTVSINGECRQGVTGVDLDRFQIEGAIEAGDTEAELELVIPMGNGFTTAGEQLFTHWLVLSFDHLLPTFDQLKPEKFANPPHLSQVIPTEVITYEIQLQNIGEAAATGVILTDLTPEFTEYIVGSATVDNFPIEDGPQNSNPFAAGLVLTGFPQVGSQIEINEAHLIRFQVRVNQDVPEGTEINNTAQIAADLIDATSTNSVIHFVVQGDPLTGGMEMGGAEMGGAEMGGEVNGGAVLGGEVAGNSETGGTSAGSESSGGMTDLEVFCGAGTRFNQDSMLCESVCGAGLRWDATCEPGRCVQESEPPCQGSEQNKSPDDGCQSVSMSLSLTHLLLLIACFVVTTRRRMMAELG